MPTDEKSSAVPAAVPRRTPLRGTADWWRRAAQHPAPADDLLDAIAADWTPERFPAFFRELNSKNRAQAGETHRGALRAWRDRLARRTLGEDPARPSTWVLDDVWRRACVEAGEIIR